MLLLGSAIGSFAAAMWVDASEHFQPLVVFVSGAGRLFNWLLFFLALSISGSVYVNRGIEGGGWSISLRGVALILSVSLLLLLFGFAGLIAVVVVTGIATERRLRGRRDVGGI